ncbi:hypothetical protein GCM10027258_82080 [Amycolatopsis stemonae]
MQLFTDKVVEVREKLIGGKPEKLLNDHGVDGWQLKAITPAEVKGRVGPGGVGACWPRSSGRWADPRRRGDQGAPR